MSCLWKGLSLCLFINDMFPSLLCTSHPTFSFLWHLTTFFGRNDAKAETPVLWPPHEKGWLIGRLWCWEGLGSGGEGDDRGWDGWMASLTRWTWVWVNSGRWWWTGRPGVLWFMGSQRAGHDWVTELNWTASWHNISLLSVCPHRKEAWENGLCFLLPAIFRS